MARKNIPLGRATPVSDMYGVGQSRCEALNKACIENAYDVITRFPRGYENRGNVKTVLSCADGEICSLMLTVSYGAKTAMLKNRMTLTKAECFDATGSCTVVFFNQSYYGELLKTGFTFRAYGRIKKHDGRTEITSPAIEPYREGVALRGLVPVYPLTGPIKQKFMSSLVAQSLDKCFNPLSEHRVYECVPYEIRKKYGLCDIKYAFYGIHQPQDRDMLIRAARRLAFDEMYIFSLMLSCTNKREKTDGIKLHGADRERFLSNFPYTPTEAQTEVMNDIASDMQSGKRMCRMVTGDVGSGKTLCAEYAVYIALENGMQAAVMAPTEILASQHFRSFDTVFSSLGYKTELITGSVTAANKRKLKERLENGDIDVIIGTHALLEDNVKFKNLGVVITDEQHRFGALQREALEKKSKDVHVLSMSATPIPRSLALVMYGDYDISPIGQMPPGRTPVSTFAVDESYRARLDGFIDKTVSQGGQVYIVCPAVDGEELISESGEKLKVSELVTATSEEDRPEVKSVLEYGEEVKRKFPRYNVDIIHGKLKSAEKERVMNGFCKGETQILVSTTVIEVGVDVANASLMVIENADRFGLSQLHQLRGRVGRGKRKSYCILVSGSSSQTAVKRLDILCKNTSGQKIAEYDLQMRGPGDFISHSDMKIRQSGSIGFRLVSQLGDEGIIYDALQAARDTVSDDPKLEKAENAGAAELINEKYKRITI